MKKALLAILIAIFCLPSFAQKDPIKWGKVPDEDLEMTIYEKDSAAAAVVLCNFADLEFNFAEGDIKYIFTVHKRIKLLKRSAIDTYGDVSIYQWNEDKVSGVKGLVTLPNGDEIKVKKRDIFKDKAADNYTLFKFSFPQLQEGAVIEYTYKLESETFVTLEDWYFQEAIPTVWSEYRLQIPDWFNYVHLTQGRKMDISESESRNKSLMVPGYRTRRTQGPDERNNTKVVQSGVDRMDAKVNFLRYVQKDVPALTEEPFITTMSDYRAHIQFQLNYVQFPRQGIDPYLSSWPDLAKKLYENKYFGLPLLKKRYIKDILKETDRLVNDLESKDEIVYTLYQYLASTIKWNGSYSMWIESSLEDCFEKKEANSGELNLMLVALLQHYEIEAYPILVSTREHGKMIQLYPILRQFNHVVALARFQDQLIAIDVDDPNRPIGFPRVSSLNSAGWLADPSNPQWIQMPSPSAKMVSSGNFTLSPDGNLEGSMKYKFQGYTAINVIRNMPEDKSGQFLQKDLQKMYPDAALKEVQFEQKNASEVQVSTQCAIPAAAQVVDDLIYLTPTIVPDYEENPFKLRERTFSVDIPYPNAHQIVHTITIPNAYMVDELPEASRMSLEGKGAQFKYSVKKINDQTIQVISKLTINQLKFEPEEYPALRNFFDMVVEKQSEQVVLRKKT